MNTPAANTERRIAHLDMDAFYASVELLRYPMLTGQPVVIGGLGEAPEIPGASAAGSAAAAGGVAEPRFARLSDYAGRGVITTATYPARAFGLRSGMPLMQAGRLCPQAVLLPVNFPEYRRYSRMFKEVVREQGLPFQDRGIDEIYIDFSGIDGVAADGGLALARRLQALIRERTQLSCSLGVAPNKLIAKLASDFEKPGGVSVVYLHELEARIWPLPCARLNGIGPRSNERLAALGINTIGELAAVPVEKLCEHFGPNHGRWIHDIAWGRDDSQVVTESEPVSMSRETTFERDLHARRDRAELGGIFTDLCRQVAADLVRQGYVARTVGVKLRFDNFRSVTRELTLAAATDDAARIRRAAGECLKRAPLERRLRLLGVRVGKLSPRDAPAAARLPETLQLF